MLRGADAALRDGADAVVVGPGLGIERECAPARRGGARMDVPLVLDADALNLLARDASLRTRVRARTAPTLITPHPAEAARLLGVDNAGIAAIASPPQLRSRTIFSACVVLKGAGSVLAYPDGTFDINASGGPALATAGTGDVLAGMLGALARAGTCAADALRIAVCLHGAAADARRGGRGPARRRRVGDRRCRAGAGQRGARGLTKLRILWFFSPACAGAGIIERSFCAGRSEFECRCSTPTPQHQLSLSRRRSGKTAVLAHRCPGWSNLAPTLRASCC